MRISKTQNKLCVLRRHPSNFWGMSLCCGMEIKIALVVIFYLTSRAAIPTSDPAGCEINWPLKQGFYFPSPFFMKLLHPAVCQKGMENKTRPLGPPRTWMCPDTAFSETPDSNQFWPSSLQALLMAIRASKLSTQLRTRSTGEPSFRPPPLILPIKWSKFSTVVIL